MQVIFSLFVALFALASATIDVEDGVLVLTDDNFEEAVAAHNHLLVEFYAPWCGHCKNLAPEWAKAAQTLEGADAKLSKIDATANREQADKHGIRGFPTIKYYRNGKVSEYNGGRTASEIVSWVNKKTGPAAKTVSSADELSQMQEKHDVVVLGVFGSADSGAAKAFLNIAADDDTLVYAISHDDAVKSSLALSSDAVVLLKSFDDRRNDFAVADSNSLDDEAVSAFIAGNSVPLIQTFSQEAAKKIFSSPVKTHFLFFTDATSDHHAPTVETLTGIAGDFKGKAMFINVPHSEKRVLDYFGITEDSLPTVVLADMSDDQMKKFPFTDKMTSGNIRTFLGDFFDGKLAPHLKSEDVQPDDTTGDVVVLRGKSFNDLVINNNKDVLVEFYAPWCGHCKKLAPTYEELGKKFKDNENVVIAKMDATANEINVPGVAVRGYPSLFFFKGNDKTNPMKYESGRELDDMVDFIKTHASNSIEHDEL